jgi:YfiH family protein
LNKLELKVLKKKDDFILIEDEKFQVVFTNAERERSFDRSTKEGIEELESLKEEFNADNIVYLKQIHSDKILVYKGDCEPIKDEEGDAIITQKKNVIIGVFTADCVPIILIDEENHVAAAIHSGWKGTFESITFKTIKKMKKKFGTNEKNLKAYIGAHIRKCCYEVSEELKLNFIEKKDSIDEKELFDGNNLNLEACIIDDLNKAGVSDKNINSLNLCTYCCDDIKLHSYRKSQGAYGRMFAFIILR